MFFFVKLSSLYWRYTLPCSKTEKKTDYVLMPMIWLEFVLVTFWKRLRHEIDFL